MASDPGSPTYFSATQAPSLGIYANRVTASVVGRGLELAAADRELTPNRTGLVCFAIEGEPGIGKTRLHVNKVVL